MSWLSQIKNNIIAALVNATPSQDQAPVHAAANGVVAAVNALGTSLESAALTAVEGAVLAHLGPAGSVLAYDFLNAIIAVATAKKTALQQPSPSVLQPPVS